MRNQRLTARLWTFVFSQSLSCNGVTAGNIKIGSAVEISGIFVREKNASSIIRNNKALVCSNYRIIGYKMKISILSICDYSKDL
jgi:hypothetical protein